MTKHVIEQPFAYPPSVPDCDISVFTYSTPLKLMLIVSLLTPDVVHENVTCQVPAYNIKSLVSVSTVPGNVPKLYNSVADVLFQLKPASPGFD